MIPSIKGQSIVEAKKYLFKAYGPEGLEKVRVQMPQEHQRIIIEDVLAASWIPEQFFIELLLAAEKTVGSGNPEFAVEIGYSVAAANVPKLYKVFISFSNPGVVLQHAPSFWKQIHNHGRFEVVEKLPHTASGCLYEYQIPNKVFCKYLRGYFKALVEMSGAKDAVVVETLCVNDGADCCKFTGTWK